MKNKILYLAKVDFQEKNNIGVRNKVEGQIKALESLGYEVDIISIFNQDIIFNYKTVIKTYSSITKIVDKALMNFRFYKVINEKIDASIYNAVYIRYPTMSQPYLLRFLKKLSKSDSAILFEIPTYPYKQELESSIPKRIIYFIDKIYTPYLKRYLKFIITNYDQSEIYNIPAIRMGNGIHIDNNVKFKIGHSSSKTLSLISVSSLINWHGHDRIIKGLSNYYNTGPQKEIRLNIIGEGEEMDNLMALTKKLNLNTKIKFHGFKKGEELEQIYKECQVGIGTLGIHRKGINTDNSLKTREYMSRGLPVIMAARDFDIPENYPFVINCNPTDDPIDFHKILSFYENLVTEFPDYQNTIFNFAKDNLTWKSKMKHVLTHYELN